ncbi:MAG: EpsG family protein [Pseudomonadota bacterium]
MAIYWAILLAGIFSSFLNFIKGFRVGCGLLFIYFYVFLVFLAGFKYESIDYFGYKHLYDSVSFSDFSVPFFSTGMGLTGSEFIWASLSSLSKFLEFPYEFFVFFIAALSISIKFYFFKKWTPYFIVAVVAYIAFGFVKDMGQLRNGLASAILLFAIVPLINRSFLSFACVSFLAFGVQSYAIVSLPLYFFYLFFKLSKKVVLAVFFLIVVFSLFFDFSTFLIFILEKFAIVSESLAKKVAGYASETQGQSSLISLTGLIYTSVSVVFIIFKDRVFCRSKELFCVGVVFVYGVLLFAITIDVPTMGARSLDMFSSGFIPLLIALPLNFLRGVYKHLFLGASLGFCFVKMFSSITGFAPYQNILFIS